MKQKTIIFLSLLLITTHLKAQQKALLNNGVERPKLVVGVVVDQMRWDYLYRYNSLYSTNGFKRLLGQGHSCETTFIPYVPTYTAVGHSCVYTGSIPSISGIVGNNWFDRTLNRNVYCTDDSTVVSVGSNTVEGKMSPQNLWVTTITDELRLSNNFKSKAIGISIKDRGSILPVGHTANAAYWYDDIVGRWISSSYYMNELPGWVQDFNSKDKPGSYMNQDWNTLLPIQKYDLSTADNMPYETGILGSKSFPYKLSTAGEKKYEIFKFTPFAATYSFDFAKTVIENEKLGSNTVTDFLAISISSTDYAGHTFGPNSIEVEDTYLRLDKDIESFLQYLDVKIGKGNYTVFLTADHGAAHIPAFMKSHQMPAGTFSEWELMKEANKLVKEKFGLENAVQNIQNYQVYTDNIKIENEGKDVKAVKQTIIDMLLKKDFIMMAFELSNSSNIDLPEPLRSRFINSYNAKRSGEIQFIVKPGYFDGGSTGTTHGLWNPYDSHIPLLWYGWGIKPGKTYRETYMTDIAATLAALLKIQMPNGCVGKVITEVIK